YQILDALKCSLFCCLILQVSDVILDNARLMLQTENTQATGEDFKVRYENEQPFRQAVEEEITSLYKVMDDAKIAKMELESQIEHMKEETAYLTKNHEKDVKALYLQLADSQVEETDAPMETSLDHVLEAVRTHWEKTIEKNRAETDLWLDNKVAKLSQEEEAVEALRAEFNDVGSKVQSLQAETESLRALKRGLENSLNDTKHWYQIELQNLGAVISKLKAELSEIHSDVEQQQDDYEAIVNNKMRLEMEIGAYHGLLEGEESRYYHTPKQFLISPFNSFGCFLKFGPSHSCTPKLEVPATFSYLWF
uniref:Beaded filament structural protein 2, phakinin n=1 Tax=Callorhinchus milii TaxID=7868 RepID=A0A4W3J3I6_CALMI